MSAPKSGISVDDDGHLAFSDDDVENPRNWSFFRKCYVTAVAVLAVMNATFASSAPSGALHGIGKHFRVSQEAANLVTTVFLLGFCAGPLVWAPLSEFYGRQRIFQFAFTLYLAFNFLCAFAPNFAALLIGRFFSSVFASCALANAPGVVADVWDSFGRGNAMILFIVMTFVGPSLGPIVAGFLQLKLSWHWTFYILLCLGGVTEILLLTLPETLASVILLRKARHLRSQEPTATSKILAPTEATDRRLIAIFKVSLARPWIILADPICLLVTIYYSLVYTLLYMLFSIYPIVFQQKRRWNAGVGELPLLGTITGACLGGVVLYVLSMKERRRVEEGNTPNPESRLHAAMIGGILFPVTMFWFAWSAEFDEVPWIVPTLAGTFLSTSILLLFAAFINYLVDAYLEYAASAVEANTVVRSACAAGGPLFTQYMFNTLGVGGAGSLIGGFAALLSPIPFVFWRYGPCIRRRSRFADASDAITCRSKV